MIAFPHLFSPGKLRHLELRNRIIMAPMESNLAGADGSVSDALLAYYQARAAGGVGMVIVEYACVDRPVGLGGFPQLGIDDDRLVASHRRLVQAIKAEGARSCLQLFHAGRQTLRKYTGGIQPVAASAIACKVYREEPRGLTAKELDALPGKFANAAARAIAAGYDAVEIHGAHGYLLGGFLSAAANQRTDEYGGSLENRVRFPAAVVAAVRAAIGDAPLIFRFSAEEFVERGMTIDEACLVAPRLVAAGADALHVSTGTAERLDRNVDPVSAPQGWRIPLARRVKEAVAVPVIAVGVIREPHIADEAIASGAADFVALGRALLADPRWPEKARQGAVDEIRPCTSCNWCVDRLLRGQSLACAENPVAGREAGPQIRKMGNGRRAVVVGGGPGGIVSALLLHDAGFDVVLLEREAVLARGLIASAAPPQKDKFLWYRDYLLRRLSRTGIDVRLNLDATAGDVLRLQPQVAVIATGAKDRIVDLPGVARPHVGTAYDVLAGVTPLGPGPVVILGGGETACEAADYAAEAGLPVRLVTRSKDGKLARRAQYVYRRLLVERLSRHSHVAIEAGYDPVAIGDSEISAARADGSSQTWAAARVLLATGRVPGPGTLAQELEAAGVQTFVVGDGREVRRIGDAVHDAFNVLVTLTERDPDSSGSAHVSDLSC